MKYYFAAFIAGLVTGIAISFLYCTTLNDAPPKQITKLTTELKKEVVKSELSYSKAVDSLKKQSAKLQSDLTDTKTELSKAKQKNYSLQLSVYDLIQEQTASKQANNYDTKNNCDSLIGKVEELIQSSSEKDSLYEKASRNLEEQLKNKDSTIALKDGQYSQIKSAFTKSIENTNELTSQNKLLAKQVKRQKFKSKVISAALFVLSSAAINYIIHH